MKDKVIMYLKRFIPTLIMIAIMFTIHKCSNYKGIVTITFDSNNGTQESYELQWKTYINVNIPECKYENGDKIFIGWGEKVETDFPIYKEGQIYSPRKNTIFYAQWRDELEFDLIDNSYELSMCYSNDEVINIPSEYNGIPVTSISDEAFIYNANIKSVTIPNTITEIKPNTFKYVSSMHTVNLPNTVKKIGDSAFEACYKLVNIDLSNVEIIGERAFYSCGNIEILNLSNLFVVEEMAFSRCGSLHTLILGDNITEIKSESFYRCISLTSVFIPLSVSTINELAFLNCTCTFNVEATEEQQGWEVNWNNDNEVLYGQKK